MSECGVSSLVTNHCTAPTRCRLTRSHSSYIVRPSEYTSAAKPKRSPLVISGAWYSTVPLWVIVEVKSASRAIPKSAIFALRGLRPTRMLPGLMSRCMMPTEWR